METKHLDLAVKADGEAGEFTGYGSVFGNVDSYGDRIEAGAFAATLAARMPKLVWQHDLYQPIGKWVEAKEDSHGLFLRGKLTLGVEKGREAYELMKDGALDGLSIGYRTKTATNEGNVRVLKEIDLWEVSLVTIGANPDALVTGVKSDMSAADLEDTLRAQGFSRTAAKAIVARGWNGYRDVLREAGVPLPEIDPREADDLKRLLKSITKGVSQ